MNAVFLDTVGLLALWNASDQWHDQAESAFATLREQRPGLFTTTFVLLECGNAAARRGFRGAVDDFRVALASRGELVAPSDDDWEQAWSAYRRGEAAQAGIVDHISFVVMRRLNIASAFTNDLHFQAAGFATLF